MTGPTLIFIIALLIACGAADVLTTMRGLRKGDGEANPVAAPLIKLIGPVPALLLLKLLCTGTIVAVLLLRPAWWPVGLLFVAGYVWVLRHNLKILRQG